VTFNAEVEDQSRKWFINMSIGDYHTDDDYR